MKIDVNSLTEEEKLESVVRDYDDIALQYCNEFCDIEVYNAVIDKFL